MQTLPVGGAVALSDEQANAIEYLTRFIKNRKWSGVLALSGAAGTGKTTLVRELVRVIEDDLKIAVTVTATTNKAAVVLRRKGIFALTFHQACMRPKFKPPMDKLASFLEQAELLKEKKAEPDLAPAEISSVTSSPDPFFDDDFFAPPPQSAEPPKPIAIQYPDSLKEQFGQETLEKALNTAKDLGVYAAFRELGVKDVFRYIDSWLPAPRAEGVLVIDEASMLGETELATAREVYSRIILVGDENQLPPVKSEPVFWNIPDRVVLTQVHRQTEGSQPLRLATAIREGRRVEMRTEPINLELCRQGMPILVWRNKTREQLTRDIREALGYGDSMPQVGEILICRNGSDRAAKSRGLINNSLWKITNIRGTGPAATYDLEDEAGEILEEETIHIEEFGQGYGVPFRFAYALTVHNSQGSEWDVVQVHAFDAKAYMGFDAASAKLWLYTAVTRAKERVIWVGNRVV